MVAPLLKLRAEQQSEAGGSVSTRRLEGRDMFLIIGHLGTGALAAPPNLMPDQIYTKVSSPYGVVPKRLLWGLCHSNYVRVGTVTATDSFWKKMKRDTGEVYTERIYTTLTLKSDATLRGDTSSEFKLLVPGGTVNGTHVPTRTGSPNLQIGNRYLIGYNLMGPNSNWSPSTPTIFAALLVEPETPVDESDAQEALEYVCATVDFTTP